MVDEAGRIPAHSPIEVKFIIEGENVPVVLFAAAKRFLFCDLLAGVFDDSIALEQARFGKTAHAVNGRFFKEDQVTHGTRSPETSIFQGPKLNRPPWRCT